MSVNDQTLDRLIHRSARQYRRHLFSTGQVCVQSGFIEWERGRVYGHSDFGLDDLDKDRNEDFVLLWTPHSRAVQSPLQWAIAVADGVTSSYRSDLGAELACWSGLSRLVRTLLAGSGDTSGRLAVESAGRALKTVGRRIRAAGDRWSPPDEFPSAWRYRLECGAFLQTTLTLAWCIENTVHAIRIGDGGAALLPSSVSDKTESIQILWNVDSDTHTVNALGPTSSDRIKNVDCLSLDVSGEGVLSFYTDGIGRVMTENVSPLFTAALCPAEPADSHQPASAIVNELKLTHEAEVQDNLSMVIVSCDQP